MSTDCIFCAIAAGRARADVVHADDHVVAFRDLNPQAPVHVLIIPREHIATHGDLAAEHAEVVGRMHLAAAQVARELGVAAEGYRTVVNCGRAAGQTVYHLHLHLLAGRRMLWPPWPDADRVLAG